MNEQALGRLITLLAALFIGAVSEFFPSAGLLTAAVAFPEGIHSDHGTAYLTLAMFLNFAIVATATFWVFRFFVRRLVGSKTS